MWWYEANSIGSGKGPKAVFYEYGNEHSSNKSGEIFSEDNIFEILY
jgi:hypothetical protein